MISINFSLVLFCFYFVATSANDIALQWNVSAYTPGYKKQILKSVSGIARKGRLHAIIGPSGSGKTTLLNVLSNTVPAKSLILEGAYLNRIGDQKSSEENIVFVQQEDLLFPQLTVQETLDSSLLLRSSSISEEGRLHADSVDRNGGGSAKKVREGKITKLLKDLSLVKVRLSKVGDAKTRGLSGGEKKRLSIGNEIANADAVSADEVDDGAVESNSVRELIIFADEPTSGLDSFQALRVISLLKELAVKYGHTVITSIHQPRASIYALFDDLTLLTEGSVGYSGPTSSLPEYFARIGFPLPANFNPSEYYIDLLSVNYASPGDEAESRERINKITSAFAKRAPQVAIPRQKPLQSSEATYSVTSEDVTEQNGNRNIKSSLRKLVSGLSKVCKQFRCLYTRALRQILRDKPLNIARLMSGLFSSLLFGAIYFRLGRGVETIPDRLGLLQVAAVNTAMTSLIKATTSFVTEKLIVQRERRSGMYSVLPYFLSKLAAEVPVSAFFPCLSGSIMYKLCGLNPAKGKLSTFLAVLTVESMAATAFGMAVGSLAPTVESAIAIAPALMVVFIVFGGLYVVNAPSYLKWVPNSSLIRWAYEALCVNEFSGLVLDAKKEEKKQQSLESPKKGIHNSGKSDKALNLRGTKSGEEVLATIGMSTSTVRRAIIAQGLIVLVNYLFTYVSLVRQRPSFEKIRPPPSRESNDIITAQADESTSRISSSSLSENNNESSNDSASTVIDGDVRSKRRTYLKFPVAPSRTNVKSIF